MMGFQTSQEEMNGMKELISKINAHTIVEIGVSEGRSFNEWSQCLIAGDLLIGIDAHNIIMWDVRDTKCDTRLIFGDSKNQSTEDQLASILSGRAIDFLRIDGGHDYETVKNDHVRYEKYVRAGGLIAFHDNFSSKDVERYVNELKSNHTINYISYDNKPETAYYIK